MQKRNMATLNNAHQAKKQCNFESCEPKRFLWRWNKVEKKYVEEHQPNQFHGYNQNIGFVNRMDQNVTKYRYLNEKMLVGLAF